jgi:phage antirepressor YoqD-like protein
MDMVKVNDKEVMVVEYEGKRVLTTEQVSQAYECEPVRIQQNYNRNQERFEEGKHYIKLEGEELKNLRLANSELQISPMVRSLMLWTRQGASRHCKLLGTDKAWDMFDCLEENYFNPKQVLPSYQIEDEIERAKAWIKEREHTKALELANKQQEQIIGELKPKADYMDTILQNPDIVPITVIAKDYGMSGQEMNKLLHKFHVIYKSGKQWLLYSEHQAKGYTHSKTDTYRHKDGSVAGIYMNTQWTQKGRVFLYNLLKKHDVFPLIEQLALPQ